MNDSAEPHFGADFAARVLNEADRILAKRRRHRWAGLAGIAGAGLAFLLWANFPIVRPDAPRTVAMQRFDDLPREALTGQTDQPEALDYLFPDAAPVARFAEQYSEADDASAATNLLGDEDDGTP
jgi:hypothetical protein